eukprot:6811516-Prymnesium_polylepis.1
MSGCVGVAHARRARAAAFAFRKACEEGSFPVFVPKAFFPKKIPETVIWPNSGTRYVSMRGLLGSRPGDGLWPMMRPGAVSGATRAPAVPLAR